MAGRRAPRGVALAFFLVVATLTSAGAAGAASTANADRALDAALVRFTSEDGGPPGIAVMVQRGSEAALHTAGVADIATGRTITMADAMRLASVAKAFSGAAALALVGDGRLTLDTTVGAVRPDLPAAWKAITLAQLLQHTSGIPDFTDSKEFRAALVQSLQVAPPPVGLLSYVADDPLLFTPGSRYKYSNSDNVVIGLMVETTTGQSYADALGPLVYAPLGLAATSLPSTSELPSPYIHGYALEPPSPPDDASMVFSPGWAWASGGIVSTPADANTFVRAYVQGDETTPAMVAAQQKFRAGSSEPPGPGVNSAGLALFRYRTRCGTVYGHTGNTAGFTQFVAASRDGSRSTTVSVNAQITPRDDPTRFKVLRAIYTLAACAALA